MAGIVFFAFFLAGGLAVARYWLPGRRPLVRWYVGASVGLLLMLWLPVLWAYAVSFTVTAHLLAALTMGLLVMAAYLSRDKRARVRYGDEDRRLLGAVLAVVVPLTIIAAWLEYTHSIRLGADGAYHVGQSTYGDLSLHLSIATSAVNAKFPLQNSLMVGATMAYPYLSDTFASTFYLLGMGLPTAMALTGTLMCLSVFTGYALLAAQLVRRRGAMWLAVCLLFLNGGLGFFYTLGGTVENGVTTTMWDHLRTVLTGYYQTPTNQPNPNNLRWVNIICDMLIPQRGILGGWTMLMPALLLLLGPLACRKRPAMRAMVLTGVIAGGMPLLHTHSFLALALCSLGFCLYAVFTAPRGRRGEAFRPFLYYGGVAAVFSLPQLINFTFVQATASDHFLRFQFNWCNNRGGNGLVDPYFWFYIKNIGLPYLLILLALLQFRKGDLRTEADRAAAQTDGLYMREDDNEPTEKAQTASALAQDAPMQAAQPVPPAAAVACKDGGTEAEEDEEETPARASLYAHDMPAYGQADLLTAKDDVVKITATRPFTRPLPPDKLRAAAFSPEDEDRVGVMRAVTGASKPEASRRPLLEEIFHSTYRANGDTEEDARAANTTPGKPETCFADTPPARDWVRQYRLLAAGAFLILLIAEFILFQPNEYDNNKLIYVWFLLLLPMAADYALELYARLKGLGGRRVIAVLFLLTCFLSAWLTVARETISDYQAYSATDIAVADYVRSNTPEHSVFVTGTQHLNPVASLAGRSILCGSDLYLYYHGFSTAERKREVGAFYQDPAANLSLLATYALEYVYVSPYERADFDVNEAALRELFTLEYEDDNGSYLLFSVPQAYRDTTPQSAAQTTEPQG